MPLRITGKNVDIGQALREHITTRTAEELGIDLSRPERGSDEEDERRQAERAAR